MLAPPVTEASILGKDIIKALKVVKSNSINFGKSKRGLERIFVNFFFRLFRILLTCNKLERYLYNLDSKDCLFQRWRYQKNFLNRFS